MNGNLQAGLHLAPSLPPTAPTAQPQLPSEPYHKLFDHGWWQQGQPTAAAMAMALEAASTPPPPRAAPAAVALPAQPPGFTEAALKLAREPSRTEGRSGSGKHFPGMQAAQSDTSSASQVTLQF